MSNSHSLYTHASRELSQEEKDEIARKNGERDKKHAGGSSVQWQEKHGGNSIFEPNDGRTVDVRSRRSSFSNSSSDERNKILNRYKQAGNLAATGVNAGAGINSDDDSDAYYYRVAAGLNNSENGGTTANETTYFRNIVTKYDRRDNNNNKSGCCVIL